MDEVIGVWGKLHNENLHCLYFSSDIIRKLKSGWMKWAWRVLVGKQKGKRPLGESRSGSRY
jgi:hypothetical protein